MINFENKKVLFIDLDGTLIKTISGKTFPEDITDFRIQLPVLNKVIEKFPNLGYFFIVTNQGGIGKFITEDAALGCAILGFIIIVTIVGCIIL